MKDLKITKGEWVGVEYAGHYSLQVAPFYGARDLLDEDKTNEAEANMKLCCDAGNTAQKCGMLPSELLKQNEELREALKNIANPIAYMESRLQEGERLNGMMALQLGNSPEYLKGIAEQALKNSER